MSDQTRVVLSENEYEDIDVIFDDDPYTTATEFDDYSIDIPTELADRYRELLDMWTVMNRDLWAWVDAQAEGRTDEEHDLWIEAVLYHNRTVAQAAAAPTCDHADAIAALRAGASALTCEPCGAFMSWYLKRSIDDDGMHVFTKTDDISVNGTRISEGSNE